MEFEYKDPLFHPGWRSFNEQKWGVNSELVELSPPKGNAWTLRSVIYKDKSGKLILPARNPYLPIEIDFDERKSNSNVRKMREATQAFCDFLSKYKIKNSLFLSPLLTDLRVFDWSNYIIVPRYTFYLPVATYKDEISSSVRKKISKAKVRDYVFEITNNYEAVIECLKGPENRKNFDHLILEEDLKLLGDLMPDNFVCFLAKKFSENPSGALVRFYEPNGGLALGWSAGIKTEALKDGVNQSLNAFSLDFFQQKGCSYFDYVGANIPPVAKAKEAWGGELKVYYGVRKRNARYLARELLSYFKG